MAKAASEAGALSMAYIMVRLNGAVGAIFTDWVRKAMPDRAEKIVHQIENCHGGKLNDSRFGERMKGEGKIAEQITDLVKLGKRKYFEGKQMPELNINLYEQYRDQQLKLFN